VQRVKNNINATSYLATDNLDGETSVFDLWATEAPPKPEDEEATDYIPKTKPKVAPSTLQRAPIPLTASGRPVRAVRQPEAGTSYNPTFEDWDDLLNREGGKEVEAEKARLLEAQAAAEKEARVQAIAAAPESHPEDDESAWEGFETDNDDNESLKRKRPERKTQAQRNKIKRRKEAERLAKHEKRMREKQRQAEQIISALIKRHSDAVQVAEDQQEDRLADDEDDTALRRRKLGRVKIPEKSLEVVLPEELQESLRRLKPEGNLLNDRFRNLLVNGKLEARKAVLQPKKKKMTFTEKWSHKDFSIKV